MRTRDYSLDGLQTCVCAPKSAASGSISRHEVVNHLTVFVFNYILYIIYYIYINIYIYILYNIYFFNI